MMMLEPPRGLADGAQVAPAEVWRALGLSQVGLNRFLRSAQAAVGLHGEVDVLLAGDRRLRRLNREFRGKDKATDVLSFPAASREWSGGHAGDLAISLDTAQRQAAEQGHSLRDEVRVLMLHGLLHLAGMDHETDAGEMAAHEAVLRQRLGLPTGLIARAANYAPLTKSQHAAKSRHAAKSQHATKEARTANALQGSPATRVSRAASGHTSAAEAARGRGVPKLCTRGSGTRA